MKAISKITKVKAFLIFLMSLLFIGSECPPPSPIEPLFENPYKNYDYWYKGHTHTHTKEGPDEEGGECRLPVIDVIALYAQADYDFLAITDHNTVGAWDSGDMLIINGCESGKSWENHLVSLAVTNCPEECASCVWGIGLPNCNPEKNQERVDTVLGQLGVAILAHPSGREEGGCPGGDALETGWSLNKMEKVQGYHAIEIVTGSGTSFDEWDHILGLGRKVWGVAADDFHCRRHIGRGWIVVNSNSDPIDGEDIIKNIKKGNFYSVQCISDELKEPPEITSIRVLGGIVSVSGERGKFVRFIDSTGELMTTTLRSEQGSFSASYIPDDSGPMPKDYIKIEIIDSIRNVAYSQPLFVK